MIYFCATSTGSIKIGFTDKLKRRLMGLKARYGPGLALLATMDGDLSTEAEIHRRFDHLRFGRTEQFRPGPDLMEFIGKPSPGWADHDTIEADMKSPVRIDPALVAMAKVVATSRGVAIGDYMSDIMRSTVSRDYVKEVRRLEKEGGTE